MCGLSRAAGQHLSSRHMTSAPSTLLPSAVMAAHRQLAACYPWPFLFFFLAGIWNMTQGIWAEVAPDGPFFLVLGAPHFWADPAVPVACAALAARSICLGFQCSAPQWLSSRLNKVGVIRGKYFSVAHMNGPLYSRPLNCISMGFDRAYQELLKNSVVK